MREQRRRDVEDLVAGDSLLLHGGHPACARTLRAGRRRSRRGARSSGPGQLAPRSPCARTGASSRARTGQLPAVLSSMPWTRSTADRAAASGLALTARCGQGPHRPRTAHPRSPPAGTARRRAPRAAGPAHRGRAHRSGSPTSPPAGPGSHATAPGSTKPWSRGRTKAVGHMTRPRRQSAESGTEDPTSQQGESRLCPDRHTEAPPSEGSMRITMDLVTGVLLVSAVESRATSTFVSG